MENSKKTGATPTLEMDQGGANILGLWEARPFMIRMRDGHGKEIVEIAFRLPNGDLFFLKGDAKFSPAQKWVSVAVSKRLAALAEGDSSKGIDTIEQG